MKDPLLPRGRKPQFVDVPELGFAAIDGAGDPNDSDSFQAAVEALYGVSYAIRFSPKSGRAPAGYEEFKVGTLEGLWWVEGEEPIDVTAPAAVAAKDDWSWTLMIRQPDFVDAAVIGEFKEVAAAKKDNPAIAAVRYERFAEGPCVQALHVGPYDTERDTIDAMKAFAAENGRRLAGKHHEIYLGDPRRARPERLRTVLRHPVA